MSPIQMLYLVVSSCLSIICLVGLSPFSAAVVPKFAKCNSIAYRLFSALSELSFGPTGLTRGHLINISGG
jgi:hypothetical protein